QDRRPVGRGAMSRGVVPGAVVGAGPLTRGRVRPPAGPGTGRRLLRPGGLRSPGVPAARASARLVHARAALARRGRLRGAALGGGSTTAVASHVAPQPLTLSAVTPPSAA